MSKKSLNDIIYCFMFQIRLLICTQTNMLCIGTELILKQFSFYCFPGTKLVRRRRHRPLARWHLFYIPTDRMSSLL